jgi:hypothetical protein
LAAQKEENDQKILVLHGEMCDPRVDMNLTTAIENLGSLQNKEKNICGTEAKHTTIKRKLYNLNYQENC